MKTIIVSIGLEGLALADARRAGQPRVGAVRRVHAVGVRRASFRVTGVSVRVSR